MGKTRGTDTNMLNIDETKLNQLERKVLTSLTEHSKGHPEPTITEAGKICGCSVSQVSKAIKKAGFEGYKQYIRYLYFGEYPENETCDEIERLKQFLNDFDTSLVDEFVKLINGYRKIIVFGYGPSHFCAQYIEYKLRFCIDASVTAPPDVTSLRSMIDGDTLLIVLSATGQYRSFEDLTRYAKEQGADTVMVSEEFNTVLMDNCDRYIFLSRHKQPDILKPHEKTRSVFFIFFEQVIQNILRDKRLPDEEPQE